MKKVILLVFLMIYSTSSFAQNSDEKRGTIKIRKVKSNKTLPAVVAKKNTGVRVFIVRWGGQTYKETFPTGYESKIFPLVFNRAGLILTDENKQWSDNTIKGFDYEVFTGNTTQGKNNTFNRNINSIIRIMAVNQYMWISGLYYSDSKGNYHF